MDPDCSAVHAALPRYRSTTAFFVWLDEILLVVPIRGHPGSSVARSSGVNGLSYGGRAVEGTGSDSPATRQRRLGRARALGGPRSPRRYLGRHLRARHLSPAGGGHHLG